MGCGCVNATIGIITGLLHFELTPIAIARGVDIGRGLSSTGNTGRGGRDRKVVVNEYPNYRPAASIRIEQKERNRYQRQKLEQSERMLLKLDRGEFHTAKVLQEAIDEAERERHGVIFRLKLRKNRFVRSRITGDSEWVIEKED